MAYEAMLLFGVLFAVTLVYSVGTGQSNAMVGRTGLIAVQGLVLAAYFIGQWHRAGQTLPMRTWHIRLVDAYGDSPSLGRSAARFVAAAMLFMLPALAMPWATGLSKQSLWGATAVGLAYVLAYAWSSRLLAGGQYLHDVLCGTRLIHWRVAKAKKT